MEKEYTVTVNRIGYAQNEIKVKAESQKEAKRIAIDKAGSLDFSEHTAEYEVEGIREE